MERLWALCLVLAFSAAVEASANSRATAFWKIKKTEWSESDEREYERFVSAIGEAVHSRKCGKLDTCLKSPANPYRASDPLGVTFASDCADLPYVLRAYFAWKNNLPFGYVTAVRAVPSRSGNRDIRYSPLGNTVVRRASALSDRDGEFRNALKVLSSISGSVTSAMFRYDPSHDDGLMFADHYSAKLGRESIRPGTVIYDPNGHVAVVTKVVDDDGRLLYIDAHPDNTLTAGSYGRKFARSRPGMGAGFKNWRPVKVVDAAKDAEGNLLGGRLVGVSNSVIPHYGDEQFYGTHRDPGGSWSKGEFYFDGAKVDYYDYVRRVMAAGKLHYDPIAETRNMLGALCGDLQDRVTAIDLAIAAKIDKKPHPLRLPKNIYGTDDMEWEEYSSPSRDARLKTSFKELRDRVQELVELYDAGSDTISYQPIGLFTALDRRRALRMELLQTFADGAAACVVSYKRGDGREQKLTMIDVMNRLYKLSFDPYHCVERRWGAESSAELASCLEDATKAQWYEYEQRLRNQIDRVYDLRMDFSLGQLADPNQSGNGWNVGPDVDVETYLRGSFGQL